MVMVAHFAQRLGVSDDQQRVNLAGNRLGVEPFGGCRAVRQFIQLRATQQFAELILMAHSGAEIGRHQFGPRFGHQPWFKNLPVVAQQ